MKKFILSAVATLSLLPLTSCDSGGGTTLADLTSPVTNPAGLSPSLRNIANGDIIRFNSVTAPTPILASINFAGQVTTVQRTNYIYSKTGTNLFNIEVVTQDANALQIALNATLGEPTDLGSRLRAILLRLNPVFTPAEVQEIINILNAGGANLVLDPVINTQINSTSSRVYRARVTSNNANRQIGSMGGVYNIIETNLVVGFRAPTIGELNRFRLLTRDHKIPFVTSTQNVEQIVERGTFALELENVNNVPREF